MSGSDYEKGYEYGLSALSEDERNRESILGNDYATLYLILVECVKMDDVDLSDVDDVEEFFRGAVDGARDWARSR